MDNPEEDTPTTWIQRNWWWLVPLAVVVLGALLIGIVMAYRARRRRAAMEAVSIVVSRPIPPRTRQGGKGSGKIRDGLTMTIVPSTAVEPTPVTPTSQYGLPADDIDFTTVKKTPKVMPLLGPMEPLPRRTRRRTRLTTYIPPNTPSTSSSRINPVTIM